MLKTLAIIMLAATCRAVDVVLGIGAPTFTGSGNVKVASWGSSFTPLSINGCVLWSDATTSLVATNASGQCSYVQNMADPANWLTNSVVENMPVYGASALSSGVPGFVFAGGQSFVTAQNLSLGKFSIFVVSKQTSGIIVSRGNNVDDYLYSNGGAHVATYGASGWSAWDVGVTINDNTPHSLCQTFDGTHTGNSLYRDGSLLAKTTEYSTGNPSTTEQAAPFTVGSKTTGTAFFLSGSVSCVSVFTRDLTTAEVAQLTAWAEAKFGL